MTTNRTQFEKGLEDIRKISMTPREKGEIYHKLYNYAEARPAVSKKALVALLLKLAHAFRRVK